jgi:hypothetical protein
LADLDIAGGGHQSQHAALVNLCSSSSASLLWSSLLYRAVNPSKRSDWWSYQPRHQRLFRFALLRGAATQALS